MGLLLMRQYIDAPPGEGVGVPERIFRRCQGDVYGASVQREGTRLPSNQRIRQILFDLLFGPTFAVCQP